MLPLSMSICNQIFLAATNKYASHEAAKEGPSQASNGSALAETVQKHQHIGYMGRPGKKKGIKLQKNESWGKINFYGGCDKNEGFVHE